MLMIARQIRYILTCECRHVLSASSLPLAASRKAERDETKWDKALAAAKLKRVHHMSWIDIAVALSATPQVSLAPANWRASHFDVLPTQQRTNAGRFRALVAEQIGSDEQPEIIDEAAAFVYHVLRPDDPTEVHA